MAAWMISIRAIIRSQDVIDTKWRRLVNLTFWM